MKFCQDHCYSTLVQDLKTAYQLRDQEISALLEQQDTAGLWERAERIRAALREHIIDPDLEGTPLRVHAVERLTFDGYTVEKFTVSSTYGLTIPTNLYLPENGEDRHPAVIVAMGHWFLGKAIEDNQIFCANLALRGIAAITFDPIFQGERCPFDERELEQLFGEVPEDMRMVGMHMQVGNLAYLLNKNVAALFTFEAQRMVDVLFAREDIDPRRIAVAGQSGGGTQACYLSAIDPRIKAVIPIQCLSRLAITLSGGIGDCEQSFLGISAEQGLEQGDLLWASLGKPVLHSAGLFDFFSVDGVYSIAEEMQAVYQAIGQPGGYVMKLADCGHVLTQQAREHIYQWICQQFGLQDIPQEIPTRVLPPESLQCLDRNRSAATPSDVYKQLLYKTASHRSHDADTIAEQLRKLIRPALDEYTVEPIGHSAREQSYILHTQNNRSAFCTLKIGKVPSLMLVVSPQPLHLDTDASVLHVTPWAIECAHQKRKPCYDLETCMFNAAGVSGQNLCIQRVHQLMAALDYALVQTGAEEITAIGIGSGCLPVLLTSWAGPWHIRTILEDCPCAFDALFGTVGFFLRETDILPGLLEIADLPELCSLSGAEVLSVRSVDGVPKRRRIDRKSFHFFHGKG